MVICCVDLAFKTHHCGGQFFLNGVSDLDENGPVGRSCQPKHYQFSQVFHRVLVMQLCDIKKEINFSSRT